MVQLTIGMPVYNAERFVASALRSLIAQDFRDWVMLIADNCSTDRTVDIIRDFCRQDSRIRLIQHEHNLGAVPNFLFLVEQAESPYFMWAAGDDEWSPNYISGCMTALESDSEFGFASGRVVNIDPQSKQIRSCKPYPAFDQKSAAARVASFAAAREVDGKANIVYSIFCSSLVKTVCEIPDIFEGWGSDMAFVAAVLARTRYTQLPNIVLKKRVTSDQDIETARTLGEGNYGKIQFEGHYPPAMYRSYVKALCRGMPTRSLRSLLMLVMAKRHIWLFVCRLLRVFR